MMRPKLPVTWIRWRYVAPRLLIAALVALCVRYGMDPMLRWIVVASGEAALGAKVEIGRLETNVRSGIVTLSEASAANPTKPMKNLFQAESCLLDVGLNDLLHKRIVIKDGEIAGIQFDSPRTVSGALAVEEETAEESTGPSLWDPLANAAAQQGTAWMDGVEGRLQEDIVDKLKSPPLVKELESRWPQQVKSLEAEVDRLRDQASRIEQEFRQVKSNPLRHLDRLQKLQADVQAADAQLRSVAAQVNKMPKQAEADRQLVMAARTHDEALLREKLQIDQLNGEQLSYYLLGKEAESNLASVVRWLCYARRLIPSNKPPTDGAERGVLVSFEREPRPQWMIERVRLLGTAQLGGEKMALSGVLADVCSHPQLLGRPAELRLSASGAATVEALVQIDRRGDAPIDSLHLECPDLRIPGRTLGNDGKLALHVPPSPAALLADVRLVGDELQGTIDFSQPQVRLQPTLKNIRDVHMADAITSALSQVDGFRAKVSLAGTLQRPSWKLDSNLGPQLASGINGAVGGYLAKRRDLLLAKAQQEVDERCAKLDQQRQAAQDKLLARLGENQQLVASLAGQALGKNLGAGGVSLPHIGHTLAEGVLK